jgi:hypothetical protein
MIHASKYQPRVFPWYGDIAPSEIDRAQTIDPTVALNREEVNEIGREDVVGYLKRTPTTTWRLTQYEYGNFGFWGKLTNKADSVNKLELNDFKTPMVDICAYLTDDDGTFKGTLWYPKMRVSGFSFGIGDPDAVIERTFDLTGEKAIIWQGDNKYFIYHKKECESGETGDVDIDLSSKAPVEDPDDSGTYILRVLRVRSGTTTELTITTDYTYSNATKLLTAKNCQVGDVIKIYYTSSTAPDTIFSENDSDPAGILADSVTISLDVGGTLYRLQSATIDVAFDRTDYKEIGNTEVVQRGIADKTVTITLGRFLEDFTLEEAIRGVSSDYGKIDAAKLEDSLSLIVKVYSDNTKNTFKYGFKATGLSPTELRGGATVTEYVNPENTLEGNALIISADEGDL